MTVSRSELASILISNPHLETGDLILLNGGAIMEDELALAWYPRPEIPAYFKSIIGSIK